MNRSAALEFRFDDPRLRMTVFGRLFVRFAGHVTRLVLIVACVTFLGSDVGWLRASGALLAAMLLDWFVHRRDPDRPLSQLPAEGRVNLAHYVAPQAFHALERAHDRHAVAGGDFYLELAKELAAVAETASILRRLDVSPEEFRARLDEYCAEAQETAGDVPRVVAEAFRIGRAASRAAIGSDDLFAALRGIGHPPLDRLFDLFAIDAGDLEHAASFARAVAELRGVRVRPRALSGISPAGLRGVGHRIMNRAWTSRPTPALDRIATDLTDRARSGAIGFLVGHEEEYRRLVDTLARPSNPNALLIGEETSGRSTIVAHLAAALVADRVPPSLFDKRLVSLSVAELVAGADSGTLVARAEAVANEIIRAGNVILFIPDIHELFSGSSGAYLSLADAFMPLFRGAAFPVVGATYPAEYKRFIEPRSDANALFEKIHVKEISEDEAETVLVHEAALLEAFSRIIVSFAAVKKAVQVGHRYLRDSLLPASALILLREALARAAGRGDQLLEPAHIIEAAEAKTNVPIHETGETEAGALLHLEEAIHKTFIDQDEAVRAVARALREYRSGLARRGGPIASFLFVGPTGVGKTELAKTLARLEFGSESAMIRFDMSEYQDKGTSGRMTGALTAAVREKPYAVVLLDEFEKANPDILNLFLQVLDDGRLTDESGRTADFTNTIVIATSNAHSAFVLESLKRGDAASAIESALKERLAQVFRPELLNRFSDIIMFKALGSAEVRRIAELQLHELGVQLSLQGITFSVAPDALNLVARLGHSETFGARPLRRTIEEQIRGPLAEKILKKELRRGSAVTLAAESDRIVFR